MLFDLDGRTILTSVEVFTVSPGLSRCSRMFLLPTLDFYEPVVTLELVYNLGLRSEAS